MSVETLNTGTTTVGIKTKDGVILASERRATMGNIIAHTHVQKVFAISDNIGMTISLITPIAIEEGLRFAIREGGRTVGSGVVTKVIE